MIKIVNVFNRCNLLIIIVIRRWYIIRQRHTIFIHINTKEEPLKMLNIKNLLIYKILRATAGWFLGPFIALSCKLRDLTKDHFREKKLGINTVGNDPVKNDVTFFKDSVIYVPTPYHVIKNMLESIALDPEDVFVDLGCGKGRVIFSAAEKKA